VNLWQTRPRNTIEVALIMALVFAIAILGVLS